MTRNYGTPEGLRLLATAARHVITRQVAFVGDLSRQMNLDRAEARELLEALAVLELVQRPTEGAVSWGVLVPAERAADVFASIMASPGGEA